VRFALRRFLLRFFVLVAVGVAASPTARGQEPPYFITYSQQMEEPENLEISFHGTYGTQRGGNDYMAYWTEFEYGVKGWWTTEFYLDGQSTFHESSLYTGFRWENRFHPLMKQHWVNPVLYVEYENVNGADKTMIQVVGFDGQDDFVARNSEARKEIAHEIETKLILSSNAKGWDISENFIGEKNLGHAPWEFGYAVGVSRPLALAASARACTFCRENFVAGMEMYGGLGTVQNFTLTGTSHYVAPMLGWQLPSGWELRVSPTFGLTDASHRFLLRFGVSYEFAGLGRRLRSLFR
jgi:hypothetical protein